MPGVGDFNLRSFFRAMGIKNPQPSMREFVQPVISVGDMSQITPLYRPPTALFGGDVAAAIARFSYIEVVSRAEGGTLLGFNTGTSIKIGTGLFPLTPVFVVDPWPVGAQLSVGPTTSLVRTATTAVMPIPSNRAPGTIDSDSIPNGDGQLMWIAPGNNMLFIRDVVNTSINDFTLKVVDLPASENSIL